MDKRQIINIPPLAALCIGFAAGIIAASYFRLSFTVLYILAGSFLIIGIIFIKDIVKFNALLLCIAFFLGALTLKNSQTLPDSHISKYTPYKSVSVSLIGVVDDDPVYKGNNTSFVLMTEALDLDRHWQDVHGRVLVKIFSNKKRNPVFYGDRLLLEGRLFRPVSFSKDFNYRDYLRYRGIYSILNVKKGSKFDKIGSNIKSPLKDFAFKLRHRAEGVYNNNLMPFSASVLNAIILGKRENLPPYAKENLIKSGTVHIIAISGLHLGIVAFIVLALLKVLRIPRKLRFALTIAALIIYCFLTGARTPVVRATIMACVLLFGYLLDRQINIYNSLAFAAIILLAFNPYELFNISFQLSFLSVISIVLLTPRIKSFFPERLYKRKIVHFFLMAFCVSASAWIGLFGLIAYRFRILNPVAVLANMILVPYMPLVVGSGFCLAAAGLLAPSLAPVFANAAELFILILFKINAFLISIPGAYFKIPQIPVGYVLLYYILIANFLLLTQKRLKKN